MMAQKTYAWINASGTVGQVITTDADLAALYAPDFVAACVDVTAVTPQPADHWTATKSSAGVWSFAAQVAATVCPCPAGDSGAIVDQPAGQSRRRNG
ncbi:hypothetical protein [Komagataeibacter sp. NFXK3]